MKTLVKKACLICILLILFFLISCSTYHGETQIVFFSGEFKVVGDLRLPEGIGPYPVILFVHGDGANDRTSGGYYLPIMERMLRAGYATFAWDKPGTGESTGEIDRSRLIEQRAQIVIDAIEAIRGREIIDPARIGLWGISQAGYVMPKVLSMNDEISFMIAVSCPGEAGYKQGAYLVSQQEKCAGMSLDQVALLENMLVDIEMVQTYEDYVAIKLQIDLLELPEAAVQFGLRKGIKAREEWHVGNLTGEYYWDPMVVLGSLNFPVLAFYGEKDTQVDPIQGLQAYKLALEKGGNVHSRVEMIPNADHTMILTKTGCLNEINDRSATEIHDFVPLYLDILEEWLWELRN